MDIYYSTTDKTADIIRWNYYPGSSDGQYPERYEERCVGYGGVVSIHEHAAGGEGDKWFYDIVYEHGRVERIFNPHQIFFDLAKTQL